MTLKEQLEKDYIEAYKAHEENRVSLLRMIKSSIKNQEIANKAELNDDEIIKLLRRELKQRTESIVEYTKGGRQDLIAHEQEEISLIEPYLPAQMSEDNIKQIVVDCMAESDATTIADMGHIIGNVMKKTNGQADGAMVARLVKEALSK